MSAALPEAPAYHRPASLAAALDLLARTSSLVPLAGGTDYYPARVGRPLRDDVLDVTAIDALRGIDQHADHWRFGATTTWTELLDAELPPEFRAWQQAAREVGGLQVQNAGTLAGNLCNASPAADGTPNLLMLDARVELASASGVRTLSVDDFVLDNRATARREDELVTAITVPSLSLAAGARAASHFFKLGARRYLVISIVMVSALLVVGADGIVEQSRIAVGACSKVAQRLFDLEQRLLGQPCDTAVLAGLVEAEDFELLTPIDDVRGSAQYRGDAVRTGVERALVAVAGQLVG